MVENKFIDDEMNPKYSLMILRNDTEKRYNATVLQSYNKHLRGYGRNEEKMRN